MAAVVAARDIRRSVQADDVQKFAPRRRMALQVAQFPIAERRNFVEQRPGHRHLADVMQERGDAQPLGVERLAGLLRQRVAQAHGKGRHRAAVAVTSVPILLFEAIHHIAEQSLRLPAQHFQHAQLPVRRARAAVHFGEHRENLRDRAPFLQHRDAVLAHAHGPAQIAIGGGQITPA